MEERWQVLSSEVVYEGRFRVIRDLLRRPDGKTQDYSWLPSNGAVAVLAFDDQGRVVLTRQYRHPLRRTIIDLPAGGIEPGESESTAALRELREETGYTAGKLSRLGAFYQSPGRLATAVTVFVAAELQPGPTDLDDGEIVEVLPMPWPEVLDLVRTSEQPVDSALAYAVLLWHARSSS